jgi:hypothetical protein
MSCALRTYPVVRADGDSKLLVITAGVVFTLVLLDAKHVLVVLLPMNTIQPKFISEINHDIKK